MQRIVMTLLTAFALVATTIVGVAAGGSPAQAASTTYYVSPSGSDAAAGTSPETAWKTLARVGQATLGPGARILLEAGRTWTNEHLDLSGSGSATQPILLSSYGTGARPVIDFGDTSVGGEGFGVRITNSSHWEIRGLEITSSTYPTSMIRNGILVISTNAGAYADIRIIDNVVHHMYSNHRWGGGINVYARAGTDPANPDPTKQGTFKDVLIQNNVVDNVAQIGIQIMSDSLNKGGSWPHEKDAFRNVTIRNNTVTKVQRDGILIRATTGGLVEWNRVDRAGWTFTGGPAYLEDVHMVAGMWGYYCDKIVFQYNAVTNTQALRADGAPYDFDEGMTNSVYQYNVSGGNEGALLISFPGTSGNVFRYNISQNDGQNAGGTFVEPSGGGGAIRIHNNTIYQTTSQSTALVRGQTRMTLSNNIIVNTVTWPGGQTPTGYFCGAGAANYVDNTFFGHAPDAGSACDGGSNQLADPLFTGADGQNHVVGGQPQTLRNFQHDSVGSAAWIALAIEQFGLMTGSAARDAGTTITDNGGLDLAGHVLYDGLPDHGALEAPTGDADATLLEDDFRTDLAQWTAVSGAWAIDSTEPGLLQQTAGRGVNALLLGGEGGWTDYSLTANLRILTDLGNAGVVVRYADPDNFVTVRVIQDPQAVQVYQMRNGTMNLVAHAPYSAAHGVFFTLRVDVAGDSLAAFVDGSRLIAPTTLTGAPASGKVGLRFSGSTGEADSIRVTGQPEVQPTAPAAPAKPAIEAHGSDLTVDWNAPADGGSTITGYTVTLTPTTGTPLTLTTLSATSVTFLDVPAGTWTATVTATNTAGTSPASPASDPVTLTDPEPEPTAPAAPAKPAIEAHGSDLTVDWNAPADGGSAITGYTVTLTPSTGTPLTLTTLSATSVTFLDVPAGTWTATVTATNTAGTSPASPASDPVTLTEPAGEPTPTPDDELTDASRGGVSAPDSTTAGARITVTVSGHGGEQVRVWLHSTPTLLGIVALDAQGRATVTIPAGTSAGDHRIVVQALDGTLIGWDGIRVTALASTGVDATLPLALTGAILSLLLGAGLIVRRRRAGSREG